MSTTHEYTFEVKITAQITITAPNPRVAKQVAGELVDAIEVAPGRLSSMQDALRPRHGSVDGFLLTFDNEDGPVLAEVDGEFIEDDEDCVAA